VSYLEGKIPRLECVFVIANFSKSVQPSSRGRAAFAAASTVADCGARIKLALSTVFAQV
jgi:hypothetical protein